MYINLVLSIKFVSPIYMLLFVNQKFLKNLRYKCLQVLWFYFLDKNGGLHYGILWNPNRYRVLYSYIIVWIFVILVNVICFCCPGVTRCFGRRLVRWCHAGLANQCYASHQLEPISSLSQHSLELQYRNRTSCYILMYHNNSLVSCVTGNCW